MSDLGRKNIGDKVASELKPDSQKTTLEQLSDKVTNAVDNVIGDNTSDEGKSYVQQASDAVFGEKKN